MSNPVKGVVQETRVEDTTGKVVFLPDLRAGWWNITARTHGAYYLQTEESDFDRTIRGVYLPQNETFSIFVSEDHRGFCYYLLANCELYMQRVEPMNPYVDILKRRL